MLAVRNLTVRRLKTTKEYALGSDQKFKVYRDSSNAIKFEKTSTDYNIIYFSSNNLVNPYEYYCTTSDACDLLKEYYRSKDPARNYGVTDSSYYEYLYKPSEFSSLDFASGFQILDNLDYVYYSSAIPDTSSQSKAIKILDLSQAIYIEALPGMEGLISSMDTEEITKKVILAPNVKNVIIPQAEEVIFPTNSTTEIISSRTSGSGILKTIELPASLKVIGRSAFQGFPLTSVVIPSSVVRIGPNAFAASHLGQGNIATLKFEKNSHLIAIYGNEFDDYDEGAFGRNKLSNVIIPKSVEYIGYHAFAVYNLTTVSFEANSKLKYMDSSVFGVNSNPINLTLTTPTDLSNWPAGTNNNITVVYER